MRWRSYITGDPRWGSRTGIRWAHLVALPYTPLADDFALPDCPRWCVLDRGEIWVSAERLRSILLDQKVSHRLPTAADVEAIVDIPRGRSVLQRDLLGESKEREDAADRLTSEQAAILGAIRLLPRVEVRGGAGSGKTWLAVEQARRLSHDGRRVALSGCHEPGTSSSSAAIRRTSRKSVARLCCVGCASGTPTCWPNRASSPVASSCPRRRVRLAGVGVPESSATSRRALRHRVDAGTQAGAPRHGHR